MGFFNLFKKNIKEISAREFPEAKIKKDGELKAARPEEVKAAVADAVEGGVITEQEFDKRLKENVGLEGSQYEKRKQVEGIEEIKTKFE